MPQFTEGEVRTATASLTATPADLALDIELLLMSAGVVYARSGTVGFIAQGVEQDVAMSIVIPGAGTYEVWMVITRNGEVLPPVFRANEDVVVAALAPLQFTFGAVSTRSTSELSYTIVEMTVLVTNNNPAPLQGKVYAYWRWRTEPTTVRRHRRWDGPVTYLNLDLAPGASQTVISPFRFRDQYGDLTANGPYLGVTGPPVLWFEDEFGGISP